MRCSSMSPLLIHDRQNMRQKNMNQNRGQNTRLNMTVVQSQLIFMIFSIMCFLFEGTELSKTAKISQMLVLA